MKLFTAKVEVLSDPIYFGITEQELCRCFSIEAKEGDYLETTMPTDTFLRTLKKKNIFPCVANFDEELSGGKYLGEMIGQLSGGQSNLLPNSSTPGGRGSRPSIGAGSLTPSRRSSAQAGKHDSGGLFVNRMVGQPTAIRRATDDATPNSGG